MTTSNLDKFGCRKGSVDGLVLKGIENVSLPLGFAAALGMVAVAARIGWVWGDHINQQLASPVVGEQSSNLAWWLLLLIFFRL